MFNLGALISGHVRYYGMKKTPSDGSKLLENGSELHQNCLRESMSVFNPKNKVEVSKKRTSALKLR